MLWAAMPEAAIHKDHDTLGREREIGASSWHPLKGSVDAVAVAQTVKSAPKRHLCVRVTPLLGRHPGGGREVGDELLMHLLRVVRRRVAIWMADYVGGAG